MIPGTWSQVGIVTLLVLLAIGAAIVFWPKKHNRLRKLRNVPLPDPWSGAIVREPKFHVTHWNASVGRAYREASSNVVPFRRRAS